MPINKYDHPEWLIDERVRYAVERFLSSHVRCDSPWEEQSYEEYKRTYTGYGHEFFDELKKSHPHVFDAMRWFKHDRRRLRGVWHLCALCSAA